MPQIIALGDINIDIIASFPEFPAVGGDALATSAEMHCGGSAANMAVLLSRLGLSVGLIGRVGTDPWGEQALAHLRAAGVDGQGIQRDSAALTGLMYVAVTPDGERTMLGQRGANTHTAPGELDESYLYSAGWLHLSGYALLQDPQRSAALLALELACRHGLQVSLDPGLAVSRRAVEEMRALLPVVDLLLPNLPEAQALTGQTSPEACAACLRGMGAGVVALKLGAAGCLVEWDRTQARLPAFAVPARDSTGAGDAFAAGFVGGAVLGLDHPAAAVLGSALGALVAAQVGASTLIPSPAEVVAFLLAHHSDPTWQPWQPALHQALDRLVSSFSIPLPKERPI